MKISVVIPLYNKAHTIVHTLQTVINQTYKDFEVVIVNDGSTDDSVRVINENFHDSRINIINQENGGVSVARNSGIKAARGEWIAFLDADDEWLPDYLEVVTREIKSNPGIDMIMSGRYGQNILTGERKSLVPTKYLDKVTEINFFENPHVFVHISATIINSNLLKKNFHTFGSFVPGQKSNEDFTFLYRVALHSRCLFIGKPLVIYNGGVEGQATSTLQKQKRLEDNILMRNLVISEWYNTGRKNKICGIFMKYETRHTILCFLNRKDYQTIHCMFDEMNSDCKKFYHSFMEKFLYTTPIYNKLAIAQIYFTKVIWRMHGYVKTER